MAVLLENRTLSMILMVPDVDTASLSSTPIIERLDRSDTVQSCSILKHDQTSDNDTISSMPVYQGSIVRIEQHNDDRNISDLIIRVPNFQRLSSPSTDTDSKLSTRIKRRAPICPALNGPNPDLSTTNHIHHFDNHLNLSQTRIVNTNRLTTGLRSLSRAFTHGCKSKRSSSISEVTTPSALPDIEVMTEKLEVPTASNKNSKYPIPKLIPPKILLIKRKHSKINKKQSPSSSLVSNNTQTDQEMNRINLTSRSTIITTQYAQVTKYNTPKVTSFLHRFVEEDDLKQEINNIENDDDDDKEQQNESIRLSFDVEQQFTAISQLISDLPISSIDGDSLSTHRYSTISANVPDIQNSVNDYDREDISLPEPPSIGVSYDLNPKPSSLSLKIPKINRPFRVQTSILQPDISVIRVGTNDLTTRTDFYLPGEKNSPDLTSNIEQKQKHESQIEHGWYGVLHPNDETFAECYEVTYQLDPRYQNKKEQPTDQSSIPMKITLDPFEYKNLTSTVKNGERSITPNEYEQIEHDNSIDQNHQECQQFKEQNNITRHKSRSVDDLSRTSNDQTSTYQLESITTSSSSDISSRRCTLQRSNSYDGFGIYVSTDINTCREHLIRQVEELSPGEQAGLKENDRILCINGTPVIQEDYTVVLQLIKHGLQTDTLDFDVIANDTYEQFKSEIDQLYQ